MLVLNLNIHLFGRQNDRERNLLFLAHAPAGYTAMSHADLPHELAGTQVLRPPSYVFQVHFTMLDWKQNSQDSNQQSDKGCQQHNSKLIYCITTQALEVKKHSVRRLK